MSDRGLIDFSFLGTEKHVEAQASITKERLQTEIDGHIAIIRLQEGDSSASDLIAEWGPM